MILSQILSYSEFFNYLRSQMTLGYLPGPVHSELRLLTWKKLTIKEFCDGGRLHLAYELLPILEFPDGTLYRIYNIGWKKAQVSLFRNFYLGFFLPAWASVGLAHRNFSSSFILKALYVGLESSTFSHGFGAVSPLHPELNLESTSKTG